MIALSVLTLLASANANSLHTAGAKGKHMSRDEACQLNPGSITQSADCGIQSGVGLSCTYGGIVAGDNHYLRRFFLAADHNITTKYSVKNVQFGIEEIILNPTTPQMPLAVNLYSIPSSATSKRPSATYSRTGRRHRPLHCDNGLRRGDGNDRRLCRVTQAEGRLS